MVAPNSFRILKPLWFMNGDLDQKKKRLPPRLFYLLYVNFSTLLHMCIFLFLENSKLLNNTISLYFKYIFDCLASILYWSPQSL